MTPIENDSEEEGNTPYKGFSLFFDANKPHDELNSQWSSVTLNVYCAEEKTEWTASNTDDNLELSYSGPEGCEFFEIDLEGVNETIQKFMGAITLVVGILLAFVGSKFIIYVFGTLIFTIVTIVVFSIAYLFHLINPVNPNSTKGAIFGCIVASILGGGGLAFVAGRFVDQWAASLIAAFCGGLVPFMLLGPLKLKVSVRVPIVLVFAVAAAYLSQKYNKFIKSAGTATIGGFFFMYGVGRYLGGFPGVSSVDDETDEALNKEGYTVLSAIAYIIGMVLVAALGTFVQLKYIHLEVNTEEKVEDDKDDFKKEE